MNLRFRCNLSSNQMLHFYCGMLTMPYHREDDGLPIDIATITCALVFIYKQLHFHTHTLYIILCVFGIKEVHNVEDMCNFSYNQHPKLI